MLAIIGESLFGLQENQESARVIEDALRLQQSMPDADPLLTARLHLALSESREMMGGPRRRGRRAREDVCRTRAPPGRDAASSPCARGCTSRRSAWRSNDYAITERAARSGDRRGDGGDRPALRRSRHGVDVSQQGLHLHRPHAAGRGAGAPGLRHPAGEPQRRLRAFEGDRPGALLRQRADPRRRLRRRGAPHARARRQCGTRVRRREQSGRRPGHDCHAGRVRVR